MGIWDWGRNGATNEKAVHAGQRYPRTNEEWKSYYTLRDDAYKVDPYTIGEINGLGLFRELDLEGNVIAETRRLTRDVNYVVNRNAEALAPADLTFEVEDDDERTDEEIRAIWRRSKVDVNAGAWARQCAAMGTIAFEAVRTNAAPPYNSRVVGYDPRHIEDMEYDAYGDLVRLVIHIANVRGAAKVTRTGILDRDQAGTTYTRVLTRDRIDVYRDGEHVPDESGDHGLGVVPAVVVPFLPYHEPGRGLWAAQGLDFPLALVDSLMTQIQAVGNRHGNPILVPIGVRLEGGTDVGRLGRVLEGVQVGGSVTYTEATLTGLSTLLDAAQAAREMARETLPEFLFTDAGASSSGSALNFRAASFVAKVQSVRKSWYRMFSDVLEMAWRLDNNTAWDDSTDLVTVKAGPVLPIDTAGELKKLTDTMDAGGMLMIDFVKGLQRIGLVPPDADAETYAAQVEAEQEARTATVLAAAGGIATDLTPTFEVNPDDGEA